MTGFIVDHLQPFSPPFMVLTLLSAGCGVIASALVMGWTPIGHGPDTGSLTRLYHAFMTRQAVQARRLGWTLRNYMILRGALVLAAILAAGILQIWGIGVFLLAAVTLGLNWLVSGRLRKRAISFDRSLFVLMRELNARMATARQPLDVALRELGEAPGAILAKPLKPLTDRQLTLRDGLIQFSEMVDSPIARMVAADLLLARTRDPERFRDLLVTLMLPHYQKVLSLSEDASAVIQQARITVFIMCGILAAVLIAINQVPEMHTVYTSVFGNGLVIFAGSIVFFAAFLVSRLFPEVKWSMWDMPQLGRRLD